MRALVFSGQGSLYPGIGKDFYEQFPFVQANYDGSILKEKVKALTLYSQEDLNKHYLGQLALVQYFMSVVDVIDYMGINYDTTFGLSLGTYGSLYATKALNRDTLFSLVEKRSQAMDISNEQCDTGLLAILGVSIFDIMEYIENEEKIFLANDNAIGQVVVGGSLKDLEVFKEKLGILGKKSIVLPVRSAFHTPYMQLAEQKFSEALKNITFSPFKIPLIDNRTGEYLEENQITEALATHLTRPVLFRESLLFAHNLGVTEFIVIDPGKSIASFIKKTLGKDEKIVKISRVEDLEKLRSL